MRFQSRTGPLRKTARGGAGAKGTGWLVGTYFSFGCGFGCFWMKGKRKGREKKGKEQMQVAMTTGVDCVFRPYMVWTCVASVVVTGVPTGAYGACHEDD